MLTKKEHALLQAAIGRVLRLSVGMRFRSKRRCDAYCRAVHDLVALAGTLR